MNVVLVALGGAVGACGRFLIDRWVTRRWARGPARSGRVPYPLGTLVVNVLASFVIGLAAGLLTSSPTGLLSAAPLPAAETGSAYLFVAVGVCGALSTYSTFAHDTASLMRRGAGGAATLNVVANVLLTLLAVVAGLMLAPVVTGMATAMLTGTVTGAAAGGN